MLGPVLLIAEILDLWIALQEAKLAQRRYLLEQHLTELLNPATKREPKAPEKGSI